MIDYNTAAELLFLLCLAGSAACQFIEWQFQREEERKRW